MSGSFFFFSHDNRFIIKTMNHDDKYKLEELLESDYIQHLCAFPDSLLARIYGMFSLKLRGDLMKVNVIVMENTCFLKNKSMKSFAFDLKGSNVGRKVDLINENKQIEDKKFPQLMKDLNFQELNDCHWKEKLVRVDKVKKDKLFETIKSDSEFLAKHNIMDYSLLLVGEKLKENGPAISPNRNQIVSSDGTELYHFGLIDYLQDWNVNKQGEHWAKRLLRGKSGKLLSAIEPKAYWQRFRKFVQEQVLIDINKTQTKHEWLKEIDLDI